MPDPKTVFANVGIVLTAVLDAETEAEVTRITAIPDEAAAEAASIWQVMIAVPLVEGRSIHVIGNIGAYD